MGLCEGRVAIVTGGGRGIGRGYALLLAKQGAKVLVNDLGADRSGEGTDASPAQQVVDEIRSFGGEAEVNGADVSNFEQAKAMVQQAVDVFGRLDILVNNAGILRDRMLVNMTESEWDAVIQVHLKGTYAPTHHAANYWRQQSKKGETVDARVINTCSTTGLYGQLGQSNYGAAKAGIASFTVIAAKELANYGVTVNVVAPLAYTRMTVGVFDYSEEDKAREAPERVAPIVAWLASPESKDVSGRVFEAGGGILSVAEGWQRGPVVTDKEEALEDPAALGPLVEKLIGEAKPNAIDTLEY